MPNQIHRRKRNTGTATKDRQHVADDIGPRRQFNRIASANPRTKRCLGREHGGLQGDGVISNAVTQRPEISADVDGLGWDHDVGTVTLM